MGGGVYKLDNVMFVGMDTFVADMGVITMCAHCPCCVMIPSTCLF